VPEDFFGIAPFQEDLVPEDFEMLDELGIAWQRRTCRWSSLEPQQGEWNFSGWDAYVRDSKAAGKKILAILGYDTDWLHGKPNAPRRINSDELPLYLNFVETVVSRYKGEIDAYEIWNEPNMMSWKGTKDEFFEMTRAAAIKVREIDPNAIILAGSFWRTPKSWIKKMFKSGILEYVDAVSFHPYAVNPGGAVKLFDKLEALLTEGNFKGDIWVTEVGYPTGGWYPTAVREKNFPRDIVKTLGGLATRNIKVLLWYEFKDSYNKGEAPSRLRSESFFGVATLDRIRKNGYYAWALCGQYLAGTEYQPALPVRGEGIPNRTVSLCFKSVDNAYTLLLWNERGGGIKIRLTLPGTGQEIHNTSTGEATGLGAENEITIGKNPIFITWNGPGQGAAGPSMAIIE
jgi:hypothetical protein